MLLALLRADTRVGFVARRPAMSAERARRRLEDVPFKALREEFCDASRSVRFWAEATAPRASGRSFLNCMTTYSATDVSLEKLGQ